MSHILPVQTNHQYQLIEGPPSQNGSWGSSRQGEPEAGIASSSPLELVRRHWILILGIVCVSLAGAYGLTRMTPPVYRASTTLYFADRQGSMPALDVLSQMGDGNNDVATEMEVMRSRALAGVVVDSLK